MEPKLITDPKLMDILEELKKRELIFHHPEFETTRKDFEDIVEETFWEVGASGKRYNRDFVLDVLEQRAKNPEPDKWETSDFYCTELGENIFLLTYTLIQDKNRITRRSTIWRKYGKDWKIVYHQGTIVENS